MKLRTQVVLWVAVVLGALAAAGPAGAGLVISQVYGGGGNSGSNYQNDYIELFNPTGTAIPVGGMTVQYAATTGTSWQSTPLTGSVGAGRYYLVREAAGTGGSTPLPAPDALGSIPMAAGAGKVALVNSTTLITAGTSCPTINVVDLVGYGTGTNCFEGTGPTGTISAVNAAFRADGGCTDTNNNAADFTVAIAAPRNSGTDPHSCGGGPVNQAPTIDCTHSLTTSAGTAGSTPVTATDPDGRVTDVHVVSVTP